MILRLVKIGKNYLSKAKLKKDNMKIFMFKNYVSATTPSTSEFWKNLPHDKMEDLINKELKKDKNFGKILVVG